MAMGMGESQRLWYNKFRLRKARGLVLNRFCVLATLAAISLLEPRLSFSQTSFDEELSMAYGDKSFVTIATGTRLPITQAPAIATVITAEDIRKSGAKDLDKILETVPGLHVSVSPAAYTPIYSIRGIRQTLVNPQVLMLINGIPTKTAFSGDRGIIWGGFPVTNIARIEVIRGPGSALYGADAFAGVINIITMSATDVENPTIGASYASYDSADVWSLSKIKLGVFDTAAYLRVGTTDGQEGMISSDAQTANDVALSTNVSLAPGKVSRGRKSVDGMLDLSEGFWTFRTAVKYRDNVGSGAGAAQALDPNGESLSERFTADLTYHNDAFSEYWDVQFQASYMYYHEESDLVLFPPGTVLGGLFTEGMIGNPDKWERHDRYNASAFYTGFHDHRLRFGGGYDISNLYKIRESRNYQYIFVPGTGYVPSPLGSVVDVSQTAPFIHPHKRTNRYLFIQDEWNFANDWTLTAGVRRDDYSDFGSTTNPRLALVWEAAYNLTAKLLYGEAFRAPSFSELYNINNPVLQGNSSLKAEEIRTLEAAVSWQPNSDLQVDLNVFRYEMGDIIRAVPNSDPLTGSTTQNAGRQNGKGFEMEFTWNSTPTLRLTGSYAHQTSIDKTTGQDAGLAPENQIYLRSDWRFSPEWSLNTQLNWVADRKREPGDTRLPVDDYVLVDLTLSSVERKTGWSYRLSVHNVFDENAKEPSPAPGLIPDDLPLPGRSFFAEAVYRFE